MDRRTPRPPGRSGGGQRASTAGSRQYVTKSAALEPCTATRGAARRAARGSMRSRRRPPQAPTVGPRSGCRRSRSDPRRGLRHRTRRAPAPADLSQRDGLIDGPRGGGPTFPLSRHVPRRGGRSASPLSNRFVPDACSACATKVGRGCRSASTVSADDDELSRSRPRSRCRRRRATSRRFAAATHALPGPTILSTPGTLRVPYASAAIACAPPIRKNRVDARLERRREHGRRRPRAHGDDFADAGDADAGMAVISSVEMSGNRPPGT